MADGIVLAKRVEQVGIILDKHAVAKDVIVRVGVALDVSGSAEWMYQGADSIMQKTFDRLLALALKFDDNGELDLWIFDHRTKYIGVASAQDEGTFMQKVVKMANWGGTNYSPVIQAADDFFFPSDEEPASSAPVEKKTGFFGRLFGKKEEPAVPVAAAVVPMTAERDDEKPLPALGIIITDGENGDKDETDRLLASTANKGVYWLMVGVGHPSSFDFIEAMGNKYPHVGYVNLSSLEVEDDVLYNELLNEEFCTWLKNQ